MHLIGLLALLESLMLETSRAGLKSQADLQELQTLSRHSEKGFSEWLLLGSSGASVEFSGPTLSALLATKPASGLPGQRQHTPETLRTEHHAARLCEPHVFTYKQSVMKSLSSSQHGSKFLSCIAQKY